jgi:hypothetical protein
MFGHASAFSRYNSAVGIETVGASRVFHLKLESILLLDFREDNLLADYEANQQRIKITRCR